MHDLRISNLDCRDQVMLPWWLLVKKFLGVMTALSLRRGCKQVDQKADAICITRYDDHRARNYSQKC